MPYDQGVLPGKDDDWLWILSVVVVVVVAGGGGDDVVGVVVVLVVIAMTKEFFQARTRTLLVMDGWMDGWTGRTDTNTLWLLLLLLWWWWWWWWLLVMYVIIDSRLTRTMTTMTTANDE